jgi:thiol-disulfide isomerase/thioredoxin
MRFISFLLTFCFTQTILAQQIAFDTTANWQSIVDRAKAAKKMIYIDFYTTWCGPCKKMDKEVFTDPSVARKFNESFICAKIDAERGEGIALAKQFNVHAYPTSAFINADNQKLVYQSVGFQKAENFMKEADAALVALVKDPFADAERELQNGRTDSDFLIKLMSDKQRYGRDINRELDIYLTHYAIDSLFLKKNAKILNQLKFEMDSKPFNLLLQRTEELKEQTMYQMNFQVNRMLDEAVERALVAAKNKKDEAGLKSVLTMVERTYPYQNKLKEEKTRLQMLFYQHGDNPQKLVEFTEGYVDKIIMPEN